MKALCVRQPYCGLIIAGIKKVENRSWVTYYSGPLAICATKTPEAARYWQPWRDKCKARGIAFPEALCSINGAVIGIVQLTALIGEGDDGTIQTDHPTLTPDQARAGGWNDELVGWVLEHPQQITPIPIKGRLGLFEIDIPYGALSLKNLQ